MQVFRVPKDKAQGLAEMLDVLATQLRGGPKEESSPERDATMEVLQQMMQDPNVHYTACLAEVSNWTKKQYPEDGKADDYMHHCYIHRMKSAVSMFDAMLEAFQTYDGKPMLAQLESAFWSVAKALEEMMDATLSNPLIDVPSHIRCMGGLQALSAATGIIRAKLDQERVREAAKNPLRGNIGADKTAVAD